MRAAFMLTFLPQRLYRQLALVILSSTLGLTGLAYAAPSSTPEPLSPKSPQFYTKLGQDALQNGHFEEARHQYGRALLVNDTYEPAQRGLIRTYLSEARRMNQARLKHPQPAVRQEAQQLQRQLDALLGEPQ